MEKIDFKKAVLPIALALSSVSALVPQVYAVEVQEGHTRLESLVVVQEEISPRYVALLQFRTTLSIASNGHASCSGTAMTDTDHTCDVTMALQKKVGSSWKTIKEWPSSGDMNSFSKSYYVTSGYDYRLKLSADVYTSGGSWVEGPTTYSQIVHY